MRQWRQSEHTENKQKKSINTKTDKEALALLSHLWLTSPLWIILTLCRFVCIRLYCKEPLPVREVRV